MSTQTGHRNVSGPSCAERRLQERNSEIDRLMTLATDEEKTALMTEKRENARQVRELSAFRTNA